MLLVAGAVVWLALEGADAMMLCDDMGVDDVLGALDTKEIKDVTALLAKPIGSNCGCTAANPNAATKREPMITTLNLPVRRGSTFIRAARL